MKLVIVSDTQYCDVYERKDGTHVQLVANYMPNVWSCDSIEKQIEYYAVVRHTGETETTLYNENRKDPIKDMNGLSVAGYVRSGRVGIMSVVRPHEIIKAKLKLIQKMSV